MPLFIDVGTTGETVALKGPGGIVIVGDDADFVPGEGSTDVPDGGRARTSSSRSNSANDAAGRS